MGISDKLCELIDTYLSERFQRATLNGQTSWRPILADVPQGSVLDF